VAASRGACPGPCKLRAQRAAATATAGLRTIEASLQAAGVATNRQETCDDVGGAGAGRVVRAVAQTAEILLQAGDAMTAGAGTHFMRPPQMCALPVSR
jgi:hypothetical protein